MTISRCKWAESIKDEEYLAYHDDEWSEPLTTDRDLFELLCLEGAQAGLSWLTVLKKRKNYRSSFHMFDISRVALMTEADERRVLESGGVVKHSGKIKSVIENAQAAILLIKEFKSLHAYFSFMLKGVNVADPAITQVAQSTLTQTISKDLKKRGFKFVGPTTVQAFLQASGLFHAHDQFCFKSYLSKKNEKTKK